MRELVAKTQPGFSFSFLFFFFSFSFFLFLFIFCFLKEKRFYYSILESMENDDHSNLDPNHTHFILIDSEDPNWGEETVYVFFIIICFVVLIF